MRLDNMSMLLVIIMPDNNAHCMPKALNMAKVSENCNVVKRKLPDIDNPKAANEHGLLRCGRFALTRDGSFLD